MNRGLVCLLCSIAAFAQPFQEPQRSQRDPVNEAMQASWKARAEGRFDVAAAKRAEARALLETQPVDSPQFQNWVSQVQNQYEGAGMSVQARAVIQNALSRAERLPQSDPTRIQLLSMMAEAWQRDRNLLKAVAYQEKVVAAVEAAPPAPPAPQAAVGAAPGRLGVAVSASRMSSFMVISGVRSMPVMSSSPSYSYQRLADLYQSLGRPDAAAAVIAKMQTATKFDPYSIASLYERQDRLDEAAAVYKKLADQAAGDPQEAVRALQSLSGVYSRQERFSESAASLQQAIDTLESAGQPDSQSQAKWLRQNLANLLEHAGKTDAADQIFQDLLSQSSETDQQQFVVNFAYYLGRTGRTTRANTLLTDYRAAHPNLDPAQQGNLLYALSSVARMAGDGKRGDEYQAAAVALEQQNRPQVPTDQVQLSVLFQKADTANQAGHLDEALSLTLQALDSSSRAMDRDQLPWRISSLALALVEKKQPDKAEQLYQRLFEVIEGWSADTLQAEIAATQSYAQFLMNQKERRGEVPEAIQRYHSVMVKAHGAESGQLESVFRMTIEFDRMQGLARKALLPAQDLLAFEAGLSGTTSEGYLQAATQLAQLFEETGDAGRSVELLRQTIGIADLVFTPNNAQRCFTRTNVALALARQKQFDEAERLAKEAIAIGDTLNPRQGDQFRETLEEVRRMKTHADAPAAKGSRWFQVKQ